jgi:hypothetical protein
MLHSRQLKDEVQRQGVDVAPRDLTKAHVVCEDDHAGAMETDCVVAGFRPAPCLARGESLVEVFMTIRARLSRELQGFASDRCVPAPLSL